MSDGPAEGHVKRAIQWAWLRPVAASLGVFVFLATALVFVGSLVYSTVIAAKQKNLENERDALAARQSEQSTAASQLQLQQTKLRESAANLAAERERLRRIKDSADTNLVISLFQMQRSYQAAGNTARAREYLDRVPPQFRKWEWHMAMRGLEPTYATLRGHRQPVTAAAFSPDGLRIASASKDTTVRLWDAATGQWTGQLLWQSHGLNGLVYSPDGTRLATSSDDYTVVVWNTLTNRREIVIRGNTLPINCISYSPDGARIAGSHGDRTVRIWDADTGQRLCEFADDVAFAAIPSLSGKVEYRAVAFSPDGKWIAGAGCDFAGPYLCLWDSQSYQLAFKSPTLEKPITCLACSPDSRMLACGRADGSLMIFNTVTLREHLSTRGHTQSIRCVAFSPDGSSVATASDDATVKVRDARTGREQFTILGHPREVTSVAFNPSGTRLVTGCNDDVVRVWDARTGRKNSTIFAHAKSVRRVAFSADGSQFATASDDRTVKIWDTHTHREERTFSGLSDSPAGLAIDAEGKRILYGPCAGPLGNEVWLSDIESGTPKIRLGEQKQQVRHMALSPDGKWIAIADDDAIKLRNAATGAEQWKKPLADATILAFSPDSAHLTVAADGHVQLLVIPGGHLARALVGQSSRIRSGAFSADGRLFAAGQEAAIKLWNASTWQELTTLRGLNGPVIDVAFNPDGSRLVSVSENGQVKLRDVRTGLELMVLSDRGCTAVFSPDGAYLAVGNLDGTVDILDGRSIADQANVESGATLDAGWHLRMSGRYLADGAWWSARWHGQQYLRAKPDDSTAQLAVMRGDLELGNWQDFASALSAGRGPPGTFPEALSAAAAHNLSVFTVTDGAVGALSEAGLVLSASGPAQAWHLAMSEGWNDNRDFALTAGVIGGPRFDAIPSRDKKAIVNSIREIRRANRVDHLQHFNNDIQVTADDYLLQALSDLQRRDRSTSRQRLDAAENWLRAPSGGTGSPPHRAAMDFASRLRTELLRREVRSKLALDANEPLR